jgi:hypothetical protein
MNSRTVDKLICCGGVLLMSCIAVFGYLKGNHDIAIFGAAGFTAFSGPLFMVMNQEMTSSSAEKKDSKGYSI